MSKKRELPESKIDRQNILNNDLAIREIEKATGFIGIPFEGRFVFLKDQVASFLDISPRTVELYLTNYSEELRENGYAVLKGKALQSLKETISKADVTAIHYGNISKTPQLGIFDFRAFLNLAMLVTESDQARLIRKMILDIVIKAGVKPLALAMGI